MYLLLHSQFSLTGSAVAACLMVAMPSAALASVSGECNSSNPLKQAFFGETHLHTGMSFDASARLVPTTPRQAYAFAKGEGPIDLVNKNGRIKEKNQITIDRPLDWGAVTDHAEFFGQMGLCKYDQLGDLTQLGNLNNDEPEGINSLDCRLLTGSYWRPLDGEPGLPGTAISQIANSALSVMNTISARPSSRNVETPLCASGDNLCDLSLWQEMQDAAEWANEPCTFTSFIGYEVTSTPYGVNWHRNVIFANEHVVDRPIMAIDMARQPNPDPNTIPPRYFGDPDVTKLWDGLQSECLDNADKSGCDVLTIPHNSNLGGGLYFMGNEYVSPMFFDPEGSDEEQRKHAAQRQQFEPLVEIFQAKGSSECRWDPRQGAGVDTSDEFCDFELLDILSFSSSIGGDGAEPPDVEDINSKSYVRNILKDGLRLEQMLGTNPFKLGIVSASDSHNGDMGWSVEDERYSGHLGVKDAIPVASDIQNSAGGGHSVVWAEENTRESIFAALKRRETYGTSGTRIQVRFFGGWDFSAATCGSGNALIQAGYDHGVPMGGDLPSERTSEAPQFIVQAQMDDFIGTPLDRIQIIKGWVDSEENTHERVIHVSGDAATDTDMVGQSGHENLCAIFTDNDFDPTQPAFYYTRVLEKPVYRYSTLYCEANFGFSGREPERCNEKLNTLRNSDNENDRNTAMNAAQCCSNETTVPIVQPVIQERAWTSPIWYTPAGS